jgi:RNA polymerase sigma-70 factor (sigma-E family)
MCRAPARREPEQWLLILRRHGCSCLVNVRPVAASEIDKRSWRIGLPPGATRRLCGRLHYVGITDMRRDELDLLQLRRTTLSADAEKDPPTAADQVTWLYRTHGMDLLRIAAVMLGSRIAAEDVVQDAFCGLYRKWNRLADASKALPYVRSAVMNRCRSELRRRARLERRADRNHRQLSADSPEQAAILGEEHRDVIAALNRLPDRQREALILRYFMDLPEPEIAVAMGISQGTVKSTTSRALSALARNLGERS